MISMSEPKSYLPADPGEPPPSSADPTVSDAPSSGVPPTNASDVPNDPPSPADWDEDLYQATCDILAQPQQVAPAWLGMGCLVVSLLLFVLAFLLESDFSKIAYIIPVLFLHEAGHFLGMQLFGYRNIRMFFIPFFGAAVSGDKHAAPVWQQVVVLLLGPLPGIVLGLVLQILYRPEPDHPLTTWIFWLLAINLFNLLPVVPFDGGRIVDVLLFCRRPILTAGFRVVAVLAIFGLAYLGTSVCLMFLGVMMLLSVPAAYRKARHERIFANHTLNMPEKMEELEESQRRDLFGWAMLLHPWDRTPVALAGDMRALHENIVSRRPGLMLWGVLLLLYLGSIGLGVASLFVISADNIAHEQRYRAELREEFAQTMQEIGQMKKEKKSKEEIEQRWQQFFAQWKKAPINRREIVLRSLLRLPEGEAKQYLLRLLMEDKPLKEPQEKQ
jgi:Zn-dependent protease